MGFWLDGKNFRQRSEIWALLGGKAVEGRVQEPLQRAALQQALQDGSVLFFLTTEPTKAT